MNLYESIKKTIEGFNGTLGVAIKHFKTGESADINGDELFPTASVFKVPVIVELYRQVDEGVINMDEEVTLLEKDKVPGSGVLRELSEGLTTSIRDLTELMMILSDNTATDIVVKGYDVAAPGAATIVREGKVEIVVRLQRAGFALVPGNRDSLA